MKKKDIVAVLMSLTAAVMPVGNSEAAIPDYYTDYVDASEKYTGAIIDCRGLNLQTAMSPVIVDEDGKKIYGDKILDCDSVISNGMAGYVKNFHDPALNRAGSNPVVFKAIGTTNHGTYPVLDAEDAKLLEYSDRFSHYFKDGAVVFVR